jgi:transposase
MRIWCGIDWSERHHDVALVDDEGVLVAKRRIPENAAGFRQLLELLAEYTEGSEQPIPVAIETAKGLLVAALRAAGYQLFPINPLAVSRYRDRHVVSRAKSDPGDALVLANILRTDSAAHRPLPEDSELAASIRVLARAQQDAVWERQQAGNKLRSLLREYYPSFLATFDNLASPDARATLAVAPTPEASARLRRTTLRAALIRGGRRRNLDHQVERILTGLRGEQFRQPALVEQAMGQQALAHLRALNTAVGNTLELEHALGEAFAQHPDAPILTSFPGLGVVLGARILGEIGDDRARFSDAKALKAFAGTRPGHPRFRAETLGHDARGPQPPALPSRLPLGATPAHPLTRRPRPLRPPPRTRRHLQRRRPPPRQPLLRDLVPLPAEPPHLRRGQGLPGLGHDRCLTSTARAMSVRPRA